MTRGLLLGLSLVLASSVSARDLGFRYTDGRCVNGKGEEGLNPSFLGPCADLRHVILGNLDLSEVDFSGAVFDFADLQQSNFSKSNLTGASFVSANLAGADLENTVLHQVNFRSAVLVNIHFGGADAKNSDFSQADMSGVLLSYFSCHDCKFIGAKLSGATLDHTDFSGADLQALDLTEVDLQGAVLDRANISQTDFTGANLNRAHLNDVNGLGARLRGAVLRQAQIERASLGGANFRGAQMDGASLSHSDLSAADLRGTKLSNVQTVETNFAGVKFSQSTVLPFSMEEAVQKGMLLTKSGALILWDERGADLDGLVQYLQGQGLSVTLADKNATQFDGKQKLNGFTAILHLLGSAQVMQRNVPADGQDALLGFVQRGGTYVATQWLGYMSTKDHLVQRMQDLVLLGTSRTSVSNVEFNAVADKRTHPVMSGIPMKFMLAGGIGSSRLTSFQRQPAVSLMQTPEGNDLVAAREYGLGKVVNFSFAGAFDLDNANSHVLNSPVVRQLILNALEW